MIVLVAVQMVVVVLLALLVAGLLRSHAEILRRLEGGEAPARRPEALPAPRRRGAPAPDILGTTLEGDSVLVAPAGGGQSSLLVFLSSGCSTCQGFWDAFDPSVRQPVPGDARLVLVTRDSSQESPSKLRELAPADLPLVMSSPAWSDYQVPLTPYFVFVDGPTGRVAGEGAAEAWPQIVSLVRDALADDQMGAAPRSNGAASSLAFRTNGPDRGRRADDELSAAGIGPGHPSLYAPGDPAAGSP